MQDFLGATAALDPAAERRLALIDTASKNNPRALERKTPEGVATAEPAWRSAGLRKFVAKLSTRRLTPVTLPQDVEGGDCAINDGSETRRTGSRFFASLGLRETKGGLGRLCRAEIDVPKGESPANRSDIEVLCVVSLTRTVLWLLSLGIFDKAYAKATAGSTDEHTYIAPDLFTAETPLGTHQGMTDQIVMSRAPSERYLCREARANPNGWRLKKAVPEKELLEP